VIIGPAGNDMQILPPTVAEFHTLNDARNASQQVASSDPARQAVRNAYNCAIVHMAPISRPASVTRSVFQPRASRSISRLVSGCFSEKSQLPPASHASPCCQALPGRSGGRRITSTIVLTSIQVSLVETSDALL